MDLRLERKDNKELVVIRSSSCVIKICETSSVFKSCHSDTSASVSQETRIFREVKPAKNVDGNRETISRRKRRKCYSEEDAMVERSPACGSEGNDRNGSSREEDERPAQLPKNVLKLIAPSVTEAVHAHSSHHINEYDMLEILIQVLHKLKSDCKNIFEKRESFDTTDENTVKLLIRECFTDIMVRYSTDSPSSPKGNSYNRCQKIISRSIKSLTLECVDIIERAICKQAKVMRNNHAERESTKSLLVKLMHIIQAELNKSKPVLKVVNTELHQPSFQFVFELLKYFIEKSAVGFKTFCQKSTKKVSNRARRLKGAGEESDNSCEISISVGDLKLDEYASRLDRLLEKVSREPLQEDAQLVIDCYHCTTKCKEQDLLLKTVTRFTEEIKQELINHARIVHEGSHYSYLGNSKGKNSREVSHCSTDISTLQSRAGGIQGDFCSDKNSSISPRSSTVRNVIQQARPSPRPVDSPSRKQSVPANRPSTSCDAQRSSRGPSLAQKNHQNEISTQQHRFCAQHAQEQEIPKNNVKPCTKFEHNQVVNSRLPFPNCLHQHKIQCCSSVSKGLGSMPRGQKCSNCTRPHGGSGTDTESFSKCRYCTSRAGNHKPCAYDILKLEDVAKKVIGDGSTQIYESGASHDRLPKPPILEKSRMNAIPQHNKCEDHKIVPKEEQGLVRKSKPDDQAKLNGKSKQEEKPKQDEKSVQDDKPSNDNNKKAQLKNEGKRKSKTPDENSSLKNLTSKKEEKGKNKSPEKIKQENRESPVNLAKDGTTAKLKASEPTNEKKSEITHVNEKQGTLEPPISETGKDLKKVPENEKQTKVDESLQEAGILKADQKSGKTKDPAHCCRMNCNCRNRRGETQAKSGDNPPRRDSMNQTDQEPFFQQNPLSQNTMCCKGCNCGQSSIPVFTNGCVCKPAGAQDGEMAIRPIYQFFANPVPVPCKCKDSTQPKDQKEAETSKTAAPLSGRRDSQETSTQTSKNQLNKSGSECSSPALSSSAPSQSAPLTSSPSSYGTSTGPPGSSSSEPSYMKSSTSQPTSSTPSRVGKSDSMVSCTCSMDKRPSQSTDTQISKANMKDACTSDTNCCCPEKIEEVFQEFDDKYSEVVKEIKFLIREGYIPLNNQQTRELTVTASRTSPKGTSSKTATCRCSPDSCKRCRGYPAAAFSRGPQSNKVHSNYEIDNECEGGFQSGKINYRKAQVKYDSGTYDECETPPAAPQYASKDTFIYNELQNDIHDLKELVKNTRFGNCPCCQCCKCEPERHGKPCPTNADGSSNVSPPDGAKNISKPTTGPTAGKDTEKQKNTPSNQPGYKSEPSVGQFKGNDPSNNTTGPTAGKDDEKQKNTPSNQPGYKSEPSVGQFKSNDPSNNTQAPSEGTYFGTAPANVLKRMMSPSEEEGPPKQESPSPKNDSLKKRDSVEVENQVQQSIAPNALGKEKTDIQGKQSFSPKAVGKNKENIERKQSISPSATAGDKENIERKNGKRLSDGVQQYISEGGRGLDPARKESMSGKVVENDVESKEPEPAKEISPRKLPSLSNKQESSGGDPSGKKGSISRDPLEGIETGVQPSSIREGSTPANGESTPASTTTKRKSLENAMASDSPAQGKRPSGTNPVVSAAKRMSPTGNMQAGSSILKEVSKDKLEREQSKTTPKKVEIDEPPPKPSAGTAGSSDGLSDFRANTSAENGFGAMRKSPQTGSEQLPQKTMSNISFGSKKSARSTTSSRNLVLSPEQEALFQSRERLREYSSHGFLRPVDDDYGTERDTTGRQYAEESKAPAGTTKDDQPGFFQRILGGNTKATAKSTEDSVSISDDSIGDSSGDSTADICRTLLGMDIMPCRFWSDDDATPVSQDVDTYIMVLETETSNDLATRDETFIISDKKRIRATNKVQNENIDKKKLKKGKELEESNKSDLIQKTAIFASKGTSTIWKGIRSPIGILKGLCNLPALPIAPKSTELSTDILERELSKKITLKPAKKLVSPLNVSSRYSHVSHKMPKSRDRKRRSGGDLRTYSSESFKRNSAKPRKTEDKEVQVTKWNAITQTAGPRKFNRTDISKEVEDKLARYLGLERMVEDTSHSLTVSANSENHQTVKKGSTSKSNGPLKHEKNPKKHARSKK